MKKIISTLFITLVLVYLIIIVAVMPVLIAVLPVIACTMTGNNKWLFLFIVTIPMATAMIYSVIHNKVLPESFNKLLS